MIHAFSVRVKDLKKIICASKSLNWSVSIEVEYVSDSYESRQDILSDDDEDDFGLPESFGRAILEP